MSRSEDSPSWPGPSGKVLLVGDVSKAFFDADAVGRYPCEVRHNALDAIDAAVRGGFGLVGVVMNGASGRLSAVLRALRKGTSARIVLLAQMYDEPIARRLVGEGADDEKLADEYLVCPTQLARFFATDGELLSPPATTPAATTLTARVERRMRHLERLATTDDLTGLKNRRYVLEFARQVLDYARRDNGRVTLLVFDIDNFKHYNDTYGHLTGDEILKQAALLMRRCCRPHDVVARIGGDEFAVVFWDDPREPKSEFKDDRRSSDAEHPTGAIAIATRFQEAFGHAELHLLGPGGEGVLTISGGLASFPRDGTTVEELLKRADQALLEAKRSGKNRIYLVGEAQNHRDKPS
jgi:diguanylate cyclase (GGDEF)-like protein